MHLLFLGCSQICILIAAKALTKHINTSINASCNPPMRFKLIIGNMNEISFKNLNPEPLDVHTQSNLPRPCGQKSQQINKANFKLKRSFTRETAQKTTSQGSF
jgi:hypothetical protein